MAMLLTIFVIFIIFLLILWPTLNKLIDVISFKLAKQNLIKEARKDKEKAHLALLSMDQDILRLNQMLEEAHDKNEKKTRIKEIKKAIRELNEIYDQMQKDLKL